MSANALIIRPENRAVIVPDGAIKDDLSRLKIFVEWLDANGGRWYMPDLAAYRNYLLAKPKPLSPVSVKSHLSTIRGRYEALLRDNGVRDDLFAIARASGRVSDSDQRAFVEEVLTRLQNAVHPSTAPVKVVTQQDAPDSKHIRLTAEQANALLKTPGVETLKGLRDTAIVALMLCTGVREAELAALNVEDLRQRLGGEIALHVRKGKGSKERLIPYGSLDWVLVIIDSWMTWAGIENGAVFRGISKGGKQVYSARLSVRGVQRVLETKAYEIVIDGKKQSVNPHDLRRTYARRLYETDMDLLAIKNNLGHVDVKTTQLYIGEMDADSRKPKAVYNFDLSALKTPDALDA